MCDPHVRRCVGKRARVTLLLKDPSRPVEEANIQGIMVSPHVSKLELVAFYSEASRVYERALVGLFLVGGMKDLSLYEVVQTVHMTLNTARLRGQTACILIGDLAKYFDLIAQDIHLIGGSHVGSGTADHLSTHTGYRYHAPGDPARSDAATAPRHSPTHDKGGARGRHSSPPIRPVHPAMMSLEAKVMPKLFAAASIPPHGHQPTGR